VIKADAYGLGAVRVARALEPLEPWGFGVATVAEAEELRAAGVARRILCLTPLLAADFADAHRAGVTPVLGDRGAIECWIAAGGGPWHLGIDTGMSRAGVRWSDVEALRDLLQAAPPEGACTHYHSAELDDGSAEEQDARFAEAVARLPARPALLHAENSAGTERHSPSRWDLVRPGIFLYGVGSGSGVEPEPVVHFRTRVVEMRTIEAGDSVSYDATARAERRMRVATIAVGYADGYRRALSNRGVVLLTGARVPVIGRVTMDMTMIAPLSVSCAVGDVVTLIGRDGDALLTVAEVAAAGELSPYELLTGLRTRAEHVYLDDAQ
jgi:alanine racemase